MGHYKNHVTKEVVDGIIARVQRGERLIDVLNSVGISENTYYRFFYEFYPQPDITFDVAVDILHEMLKTNRTFTVVVRGRGIRMSVAKKAFEEFGLPIRFRKQVGHTEQGIPNAQALADDYKPGRFVKCSNCAIRSQCNEQGDASACDRYKADIAQRHREIQMIGKERLRQIRNGIKKE